MTTPSDSPEPPAENVPPVPPADAPAADAAQTRTAGPPAPSQAPVAPTTQPFAPVPRAHRTPWVNPARRAHVVAAAVLGALIFGGGGILVGHAVSDHGERHGGAARFEHGPGGYGPGFGRGQQRYRELPRQHGPNGPKRPVPPTPAPSGSATS
jgi:hypothetical protein